MQTFDCVTTAICDDAGACAPPSETLVHRTSFRIEPVAAGRHGEGEYRMSYNDVSAEMTNVTGLGPLLWSEGRDDTQVILFTSETSLLWQSFDLQTRESIVSFLTCEEQR